MVIDRDETSASGSWSALDELGRTPLGLWDKAMPAAAADRTAAEFLASRPRLSTFSTPVLVLDDTAMTHNIDRMARWCASRGLELAPHGKTTMAPQLWRRQLDAGAWGITVATGSQLRVALSVGVRRVQLANALVDPPTLAWLAGELDRRPEVTVLTWADGVGTVRAMSEVLRATGATRPVPVLVELGAAGGRTGARGADAALEVADAVRSSPQLVLAGVSGYEGSLAHDASPEGVDRVRAYLAELAEVHRRLLGMAAYEAGPGAEVYVTAGGSAYFDDVADLLAPLAGPAEGDRPRVRVLLRSGAYVIHDDGFYRAISPFARTGSDPLRSAMHVWSRVVSRPEPDLALLDAGKRDMPFDEGLPEPQLLADDLGRPARPLTGAEVTEVNDQHAFLRLPGDADVRVGQVVRLGLSHPCTALDKWRVIPVVDTQADDPVVTDLVRTLF
jgi:D-serine deaminase-like pyridoxal phosphate-dependent protein